MIRSMGGKAIALSEIRRGNKEESDQRILGCGSFVSTILQQAEKNFEKKYLPKRPIEDLITFVADRTGIEPQLIRSRNRQRRCSKARALVAWMAVEEVGHSATEVARYLGISRVGVQKAVERELRRAQDELSSG